MGDKYAVGDAVPQIDESAWIAPGAIVIGTVSIGPESSVYYGCVLRADWGEIAVGSGTNLQDGTIVHADPGFPTSIGDRVSVGHRALIHGAVVEDDVLVGMSSTVLNGAHIGTGSLIAAGAVVLEGTEIPPHSLVAGVPAKVRRTMTESDRRHVLDNADHYLQITELHKTQVRPVDG
ncbi:gamma carbonic anhydrase family protein [Spelaeicoccus albus]|uniref:Carbonic anhydrase/acetyltransferase-like protein (Isoleucine patch superfamily) n=1 Tax=Spelaeicoccus albus TaxID=1280376 RepID=A0A7Z0D356_9MICO|nr:gamma carbonic anhydrase family protein [Spelaeicoccus albus]NYI67981.1 carbonic anhydrase/acetyltransferase-like protein (isoleucine patch superfamily) [Spelaeicoccus albus]